MTTHGVKDQHSTDSFHCVQCEKIYSKRANLKAHIKTAHEQKSIDCQICKKSFTSQHRKDQHYERCKEKENTQLKDLMQEFVDEIDDPSPPNMCKEPDLPFEIHDKIAEFWTVPLEISYSSPQKTKQLFRFEASYGLVISSR